MYRFIAALCMLVSMSCFAGYKGQDPLEMGRTADRAGNGYHLYSFLTGSKLAEEIPICAGRKHMLLELAQGYAVFGCWWGGSGKQLYGYTEHTGTVKFPMDLMTLNDNFTGKTGTGF